jgi:hypothetical protein
MQSAAYQCAADTRTGQVFDIAESLTLLSLPSRDYVAHRHLDHAAPDIATPQDPDRRTTPTVRHPRGIGRPDPG